MKLNLVETEYCPDCWEELVDGLCPLCYFMDEDEDEDEDEPMTILGLPVK
jgi:hypothetical protein